MSLFLWSLSSATVISCNIPLHIAKFWNVAKNDCLQLLSIYGVVRNRIKVSVSNNKIFTEFERNITSQYYVSVLECTAIRGNFTEWNVKRIIVLFRLSLKN